MHACGPLHGAVVSAGLPLSLERLPAQRETSVLPLREARERLDPGAQFLDLRQTFTRKQTAQPVPVAEPEAPGEPVGGSYLTVTVGQTVDDVASHAPKGWQGSEQDRV